MNATLDIAPLLLIEDYKEQWDAPDDVFEEIEGGNDDVVDRLLQVPSARKTPELP